MQSWQEVERYPSGMEMSPLPRASTADLIPAPKHSGLTANLLFLVLLLTLGTGIPLGYNIVALNAPQTVIVNWIRSVGCRRIHNFSVGPENSRNTSRFELWCHMINDSSDDQLMVTLAENPELNTIWALTSALFSLGGIMSVFTTGYLMKVYGLKSSILMHAAILIVGTGISCLSDQAQSYEMLIFGRVIVGVAVGSGNVLVPIYISEISPVALRGALGTLPTTMFILGMIIATTLGLPYVMGNEQQWPLYLALHLVPVLVMCAGLSFCPESPRQLFARNAETDAAQKALIWLRKSNDVQEELLAIQAERDREKVGHQLSLLGLFRDPFLRSALWLCVVPMIAMHTSGFSCLSFYSTFIFSASGLSPLNSIYASLGLWTTFLFMNLTSLVLVDRNGRRVLLLTSHVGVLISLGFLVLTINLTKQGFVGSAYGSVTCIFAFIVFHGLSLMSVPWILGAELFTQEARPAAMMFVSIVCWGTELVAILLFPLVIAQAGEFTFCIFIGFIVLTGSFTFWALPETKGSSMEEIQTLLQVRFDKNK
ncbi:Solute carrier family 2, facilitated glucose transporter member 1 [Hypsibius exemplaris]|uniref:Solute carrier family 2, facilitated glucose transporter member 1 n=1 Tax=Hypsibius exemplaris TaxID=2072580 RepID=A0A1W0WJR6_HYPEX|nr:Solute carrier family 2, facilitated glucose transporter member 1 [Hypsibius exemplaris]